MAANPCVQCGACCAFFRVQYYWREVVPAGLFEDLNATYRCMKGTAQKHRPQCAGLKGRIGTDARCSIYKDRPSPCRAFTASYSDGQRHPRCDEARQGHGLLPLRREDWVDSDGEVCYVASR